MPRSPKTQRVKRPVKLIEHSLSHDFDHNTFTLRVPQRLVSINNERPGHWRVTQKAKVTQRDLLTALLYQVDRRFRQWRGHPASQWAVNFVRITPKKVEDDNVTTSFKWVRDTLARWCMNVGKFVDADSCPNFRFKCASRNEGNVYGYEVSVCLTALYSVRGMVSESTTDRYTDLSVTWLCAWCTASVLSSVSGNGVKSKTKLRCIHCGKMSDVLVAVSVLTTSEQRVNEL